MLIIGVQCARQNLEVEEENVELSDRLNILQEVFEDFKCKATQENCVFNKVIAEFRADKLQQVFTISSTCLSRILLLGNCCK